MKRPIHLLVILISGLLVGCGQGGSFGNSGDAAEIEGTYIPADGIGGPLIIKNGTYQEGFILKTAVGRQGPSLRPGLTVAVRAIFTSRGWRLNR